MEFLHTDPKSLLSEIKEREKQLIFKRRWLIGLPASTSKQKKLQDPAFVKSKSVPESLLREDDVFYETVRYFIEKGFGESSSGRGHYIVHNHMDLLNSPNVIRLLVSFIDDLTCKGLYNLACLVTGGSVMEKTRKKLKKVINKNVSKLIKSHNTNNQQVDLLGQLSQFLMDGDNFQNNCLTHWTATMQYHHAAVSRVLDGLEDMPFQTLDAMLRKLKGVPGRMPQFLAPKSICKRDRLVNIVRNTCLDMISELDEQDELPEPLAKSMAIAKLSMKLNLGRNPFTTEFYQFSSEHVALQNEIIKAVWWLKGAKLHKLKKLQAVLDPNAEVSSKSLRTAVITMLTEYLFECGDIDTTPKFFLDALTVINKESTSLGKYELIEEDIECVLGISAHMKQILLDLLPHCRFDQDFIDAYMEDFEESDDDANFYDGEQHSEFDSSQAGKDHSNYPNEQLESMGDTSLTDSNLCISFNKGISTSELFAPNGNNYRAEEIVELSTASRSGSMQVDLANESWSSELANPKNDAINPSNLFPSNCSNVEAKYLSEIPSSSKNDYCAIQEACDKSSIVSYFLLGHVLEMFAQREHLNLSSSAAEYLRCIFSINEDPQGKRQSTFQDEVDDSSFLDVVEKLIPSFPKSGLGRLKGLMDLQ